MICSQQNSDPASPANDPGQALIRLCDAVLPIWLRQIAQAKAQSEAACGDMLAAFAPLVPLMDRLALAHAQAFPDASEGHAPATLPLPELGPLLSALETPLQTWGDCRDRLFVSIQYQDRINQMLQLLQDDMGRLTEAMQPDAPVEALAVEPWLQRLQQAYAMAEQRDAHHPDPLSASSNADDEIDYF